jgi:coenzyme F420-0:L-glutamate ligase/coenzyme F420-1:gamma-L-glutamate ligase
MYRRARDPALACAPRGGGLPEEVVQAFLDRCRVAHLATADRAGTPHVIPICFACDWAPPEGAAGWHIYSVIDAKPKCVVPLRLKRVRNVLENPQVALVADRYDEDWSRLGYVLVTGTATVITEGPAHARALALLRDKYPQYRTMDLERAPVLQITPCRWVSWGNLNGAVKTVPPPASAHTCA